MATVEKQKILSVPEVKALYTFASVKAVYQAVHRRQIPFRHLGTRVVFLVDELDRFFDELPGNPLDDDEISRGR